jgi:subtilisin family serine protease
MSIRRIAPPLSGALAVLVAWFAVSTTSPAHASYDGKEKLDGYPEITLLIEVKDARKAAELVKKAGGQVIYDPNLGIGHDIPFLVVNLPGEKVVDEKFLKSLELRSGVSSAPTDCGCEREAVPDTEQLTFDSLFVPLEDIQLTQLRQRVPGQGRGKGVIVAVIDTGVDASHPVFQDRVIYWSDATREGRIQLEKLKVFEGKVTWQDKELTVPKRIADNKEIFVGTFDETAMGIQLSDAAKTREEQGLDFNRNDSVQDKFLVMIGRDTEAAATPKDDEDRKDEAAKEETDGTEAEQDGDQASTDADNADGEDQADDSKAETQKPANGRPFVAFLDVDGDGALKDKEAETPIADFNTARKLQLDGRQCAYQDLVVFPSRTKTIAYPLLFRPDSKGVVAHATLGIDFRSHGTHVAGIIAGNGDQIQGAAPEAHLMSLKACSGISCTESAILRAILEAFFNPQGYVPDVVNISLGSPEEYDKDRMDRLIQDLCAKFGTVFCVSASNDGTGYRSINHLGSLSPAVLVGASVSRQTLAQHYQLQEGVPVPEHCLLYFSSLGPSYTGQLRPNLVAPGSALSSTALISDGSSMKNGTSMAAPIAAGAVAALLSAARTNPEFAKLNEWRRNKIQAVKAKSDQAKYSLTTFAVAVRTALEESATELPDYTLAQQGHGLLNIDAAYDQLIQLATEINARDLRLPEFEINNNLAAGRLYDRSNDIPPVKRVSLALDVDGELSEAVRLRLRNAATEVRLERVQIQSVDGTVENLAGDQPNLPFSIAVPGKEDERGRSLVLVLSNTSQKGAFLSRRHLDAMEPGKTYLAHYDVYQSGQRLLTLLDVVHKPIELSDLTTEVNLPGIEIEESNPVACYTISSQAIAPMAYHRYPVAVTHQDSALNVEIGFCPQQTGSLMVQVYDPDGHLRGRCTIQKSAQMTSEDRTDQLVVKTDGEAGIWEVTVTAYSGAWVGPSAYDLLVEAYRFVPSVERIQLGSKSAGSGSPGAEQLVSVLIASRQAKSLSLSWEGTERIAPMQPFGIIPNHRTYKRVPLPAWSESQGGSKETTVVLELQREDDGRGGVSGRIDHRLYRKQADGKFVEAHKAEKSGASSGRKVFKGIPRPEAGRPSEPLYAAMEVFNVYPDGPSLSQFIDHVDMLAVFPEIPVRFQDPLNATLLNSASTPEVKILRVTAPTEVIDETTKSKSRKTTATLKVDTGDANLPEISIELPVTLADKKPSTGPKATQRARSRLQIKTDHPHISATVPVVISQ